MQPLSLLSLVLTTALVSRASPAEVTKRAPQTNGIDVSGDQPIINWDAVRANVIDFVYIKATEGLRECPPSLVGSASYPFQSKGIQSLWSSTTMLATRDSFAVHTTLHVPELRPESHKHNFSSTMEVAGILTVSIHIPSRLIPTLLDTLFQTDYTLPGAVELEGDCGGLSQDQMVQWIRGFSSAYRRRNKQTKADARRPGILPYFHLFEWADPG